jgi:hypothetical protein
MAPVVRIESNRCQDFLSHDDAIDNLKAHGWDVFLNKFKGYTIESHSTMRGHRGHLEASQGDLENQLVL